MQKNWLTLHQNSFSSGTPNSSAIFLGGLLNFHALSTPAVKIALCHSGPLPFSHSLLPTTKLNFLQSAHKVRVGRMSTRYRAPYTCVSRSALRPCRTR